MFLDLKVFIFLDMNFSRNLSKNFIKCKKWFEKSRWSSFITIPILIKKKHIHSNIFMIVCWKSRDLVCCYSKIWKSLSPDETRRSFIQNGFAVKRLCARLCVGMMGSPVMVVHLSLSLIYETIKTHSKQSCNIRLSNFLIVCGLFTSLGFLKVLHIIWMKQNVK